MTSAGPGTRSSSDVFRVGDVFQLSLALFRRHWIVAIGLTFISSFVSSTLTSLQPLQAPWIQVASFCQGHVLETFAETAIFVFAMSDRHSGPITVRAAFRTTAARAIPALATFLVSWLLTIVGLVFLVVPGLIVKVMFMTAVPVCVLERLGPLAALLRSADLSRGHRWRMFAALLAANALMFLSTVLNFGLVALPALGVRSSALAVAYKVGIVQMIGALLWASSSAFGYLVILAVYDRLRFIKEGAADAAALSEVFR